MDDNIILSERKLRWLGHVNTNWSPTLAQGGSRVQEGSRSSTCQLEELRSQEHRQQRLVKDGRDRTHLGGSRGGSSKQIRMAWKCGQCMHLLGLRGTRVESRSRSSRIVLPVFRSFIRFIFLLTLSFRLWIPQVRGQPHGFFFSIQLDSRHPPRFIFLLMNFGKNFVCHRWVSVG